MSDKDDPFGLMNDAGRTRIRPAGRRESGAAPTAHGPGSASPYTTGSGPAYAPPPPAYGEPRDSGVRVRHARAHPNPLVAAFAALLEFAPELERAASPASPETLRVRLLDNLIDGRDSAVARGVPLARADQAAWFVAALIDDLAINTPWGGQSDWPRAPLVVSLAGDVDPGTRFFERLSELQRYPDRDPEMLELAHTCLALGFRGRFRFEGPQAQGGLVQALTSTVRLLRNPDAERAPLSPHWTGVAAPDEPRRFAVPLWTIGLLALAVVAGVYVALGIRLSGKGEQLYTLAGVLPPSERAEVFRPLRSTDEVEAPPEIVIEPVVIELLPEFQQAAPPDVAAALSGREDVSLAVLVVRGSDPEVFRSAKADLNSIYEPLVASFAAVILANIDVIGGIAVIGHTDSVPVQRSNPFASNQGLSEARAGTIAAALVAGGVPSELIRSEGRAATEPVGDNATREGRALNRRVEIRIQKKL